MKNCCFRQTGWCVVLAAIPMFCAQGAGFGLYETGARGTAMGGALVGETGDASANYYNPANLTDLSGTHVMAGATALHPVLDLTANGEKNNLDSKYFFLPHVYGSQQLSDDWFIGVGVYSEFGLGTEYDSDWVLNSSSTKNELDTLTINPNVAYKITDRLSAVAGFRAMYLNFEHNRTVYDNTLLNPAIPLYGDMRTHIQGDSWGFGYNLGLSYKLTDTLAAGFTYRSRVRQIVKGDIDVDSSTTPSIPGVLPDGSTSARGVIVLPPSWTAGLNYHPVEKLHLGVATTYTEWSTYDDLTITFGKINGTQLPASSEEKDWHNVWRTGIGAEYLLTERWSVQCGYVYDMDPIDKDHCDTMLPPGDRHIVSTGLGYMYDSWTFNCGYGLIIMEPRKWNVGSVKVDFDDGFCHMLAVSVGKNF